MKNVKDIHAIEMRFQGQCVVDSKRTSGNANYQIERLRHDSEKRCDGAKLSNWPSCFKPVEDAVAKPSATPEAKPQRRNR
jgi:methyl coenzyme M reductase alpha subunit